MTQIQPVNPTGPYGPRRPAALLKPPSHPTAHPRKERQATHPSTRAKRRSLSRNEMPHIESRTAGNPGSPATGEKPSSPEHECSSMAGFSPADVPKARRFCLASSLIGREAYFSKLLNRKEKWRGLRFLRAGRWARKLERKLVFGAVSWPSGSRPSLDGRDLAIRRNSARSRLRLCGFGWAGGFAFFAVQKIIGWADLGPSV
jgi:hypothetical protein